MPAPATAWPRDPAAPITAARAAVPPLEHPVVYDQEGRVWLLGHGPEAMGWHLHCGMICRWLPLPFSGGVMLQLLAGTAAEPDFEDDGIAVTLTRPGLSMLIEQLQSIDAQLDDA